MRPIRILFIFFCLAFVTNVFAQYNWKMSKDKDGIKVYKSEIKESPFEAVKIECTLDGTIDKLVAILNNVKSHKQWVYNNKTSALLKRVGPYEFYYYTETDMPWPIADRDGIMHLKMTRDSDNRVLKVIATGVPDYIPEKEGKIRIPRTNVNWYVTMATKKTIHVVYILEADPGGSVSAWMANSFAEKGPFESFKKLREILKK